MSGEIGVESMETRGKNDYFEERPTKRKKVDSELLLRELKWAHCLISVAESAIQATERIKRIDLKGSRF